MIYCARQLVENAWEHNTQIFMLFIDLRKAYDSIPCSLLWHVLEKYGIPPSLLNIVCSLPMALRLKWLSRAISLLILKYAVHWGRIVLLPRLFSTLLQPCHHDHPIAMAEEMCRFWSRHSVQLWWKADWRENTEARKIEGHWTCFCWWCSCSWHQQEE